MPTHPPRLNLLGRAVPAQFEVGLVVLAPGCVQPFRAADWRDMLVEVDRGQVELELRSGARHRVSAGDLLWLGELPLRVLRNPESEPAVLVTLARRPPPAEL